MKSTENMLVTEMMMKLETSAKMFDHWKMSSQGVILNTVMWCAVAAHTTTHNSRDCCCWLVTTTPTTTLPEPVWARLNNINNISVTSHNTFLILWFRDLSTFWAAGDTDKTLKICSYFTSLMFIGIFAWNVNAIKMYRKSHFDILLPSEINFRRSYMISKNFWSIY